MKGIHKDENKIFTDAIFYKSLEKLLFDYYSIGDIKFYKLLKTPLCKVSNFSYEFAMRSKNKILRDFSKISLIPLYINIKKRT